MKKKLLDIYKLDEDLKKKDKYVEGIIGYDYSSLRNCGNFSIGIDTSELDPYWVEVEID